MFAKSKSVDYVRKQLADFLLKNRNELEDFFEEGTFDEAVSKTLKNNEYAEYPMLAAAARAFNRSIALYRDAFDPSQTPKETFHPKGMIYPPKNL